MNNHMLPCGCSPENGVCCDRALELMDTVRDAINSKGTAFGFKRLEWAKQNLANHYKEGEKDQALSQ